MKPVLVHLDEATYRKLARIAPPASRRRAQFIRDAIRRAVRETEYAGIRKAYEAQPDSETEADDWSTAEDYKFVVAEVTTTVRNIPVEVPLGHSQGLSKKCVANCDNLRTVARSALARRAGALAPARVAELKRAVGYALGWEELIESGS